VLVAKDGADGIRLAASEAPAVIFLDIRMPKMDGIEVLRNLRSNEASRHIPVVMLSNYDDRSYINVSLGLGAKEYIVKAAIKPKDLAAVASRWIVA
jgi:CheY-like chemotaxis protein